MNLGGVFTKNKLDIRAANAYSPLALAFLGDAVYEQLVRERIVLQANMPVGKLHAQSIKKVCAEYQAKAVESIMPMLTEEEHAVFKRGRNTSANTIPKHSTAGEYRYATALESLFGYLHLIGERDRCEELFNIIWDLE